MPSSPRHSAAALLAAEEARLRALADARELPEDAKLELDLVGFPAVREAVGKILSKYAKEGEDLRASGSEKSVKSLKEDLDSVDWSVLGPLAKDARERVERQLGFASRAYQAFLVEKFRRELAAHGVTSGYSLRKFGPERFKKVFGKADLGTLLGRKILGVSLADLRGLCDRLGWKWPEGEALVEKFHQDLAARGVTDGHALKALGPTKFKKTFGVVDLGTLLGRKILGVSLADLRGLCDRLGWKWPEGEALVEKFRQGLAARGVTDGPSLKALGSTMFQKRFGVKDLGILLNRSIHKVSLADLAELCAGFGWEWLEEESLVTTQEWFSCLAARGVTDGHSLKALGSTKFQKTFGVKDLGILLGRVVHKVSLADLKDFCTRLGWEWPEGEALVEKFRADLASLGIANGSALKIMGPAKFQRAFGTKCLGDLFGRALLAVYLADLKNLCKRLDWEWPEGEALAEQFRKDLAAQEVTDGISLKSMGPTKFKKVFGVTNLGALLGRTIRKPSIADLKELCGRLEWEWPEGTPPKSPRK